MMHLDCEILQKKMADYSLSNALCFCRLNNLMSESNNVFHPGNVLNVTGGDRLSVCIIISERDKTNTAIPTR